MNKELRGEQFQNIFDNSPDAMLILDIDTPVYTILGVNKAYLAITHTRREDLIGRSVFSVFPESHGTHSFHHIELVIDSFEQVIKNKEPYTLNDYRYDIPAPGGESFEERYWTTRNIPVFDAEGKVSCFIHSPQDVTARLKLKQKERAGIEEAEERARLVVDSLGLGTYDLNISTGEMVTSLRFANIFGFDEPVTHREYLAMFLPEDLPKRDKAYKEALVSGRLMYEARIRKSDNSIKWLRAEGKVLYNHEKTPVRILGIMLDITERRQAKEDQRKLITLVNNSVDLMSILNMEGKNSYINDAGKKLLGFRDDQEVLTTPISELHTPEDFEQVSREVLPTVMEKGKWSGTMMVRHLRTGEVFPVFNNSIRIDDPVSGRPIAVGAVMRDMRPELTAKQALADSEQLLRKITTASPAVLWMSDEEGLITYFNQAWLDWTGLSYERNMKTGWLEAIHTDDRERVRELFINAHTAGSPLEVEFRLNHSDGTIHWCIANGEAQYRSDGRFMGYIGACVDITEQKHLQQQKDDFIGIASHELKTPVTSIKAYTQVLEKILTKKGESREALMIGKMDGQINRLTNLISDLLDVTKINSGKLQFNNSEFEFNPLLEDLIEDLQRTTDRHTLVKKFDRNVVVFGDQERIGQVVSNLITNAIKYSPNADKIVISTRLDKGCITLCVRDFGIGIPDDKLEKVFEQFYRVSGDMQHTFPGLGLGLYISAEIIKREGGRIWVDSKVGEGSTFCFSLPVEQ